MTRIPDEAVQAALEQIHAYDYVPDENDFSNMKDAIKSALSYISAPCSVEVRKLGWDGLVGFVGSFSYVVAPPSFTKGWRVWGKISDKSASVGGVLITTTAADEEEAKAAAQADFERRILSCVATKPVDVAAVRRQAFEEGFENGVEQSINALYAYDDITRNEAEQSIRKLKPDYRALSHELVSRSALEKGGR